MPVQLGMLCQGFICLLQDCQWWQYWLHRHYVSTFWRLVWLDAWCSHVIRFTLSPGQLGVHARHAAYGLSDSASESLVVFALLVLQLHQQQTGVRPPGLHGMLFRPAVSQP